MSSAHRLPEPHVEACRAEFRALVAAYRDVVAAASKASGASLVRVDAALAGFEPGFFNNLLVALEARFARRSHGVGDKDGDKHGGAPDEVRALCASLVAHGGVMTASDAVRYDPARSVLRIDFGDRIALNADDFEALAAAFLAEVERQCPG